jgi:hypothetical protein
VTSARDSELRLRKAQADEEAKREAKRKERKAAAAAKMRAKQEKAKERKLTAEKLAEAEALLREQANEDDKSEEDEGLNDGDRSPASRANTLTDVDYRRGQNKEGFNVVVLHDDEDDEDDNTRTHRTTSTVAQDFLQQALLARGSTKRKSARKSTTFNSGKLAQPKSYKRKRPTKQQKRVWEAEKQRLALEDGSGDEGELIFE